jgi:hypothetical protein
VTATAPTRHPFAEARVCVIGPAFSEPVLRLLAYSRWQVERIPDVNAAAAKIESGSVPVVICREDDWRKVVEMAHRSLHPPGIIVLTDAPKDSEWMEVLNANACYLDVRNIDAPGLFSLLNLLWRARNNE